MDRGLESANLVLCRHCRIVALTHLAKIIFRHRSDCAMHVQCNTISLPSINTIARQMFCGSKYDAPYHHFTVIMTLTPPMIYTPGPLSPCFTAIMTLTPPMTLHTRPTVHTPGPLFYCHHDPDPSNDPTHQAQHPALLSSWPWPLQWSYTSGPLGYCHPVLLSSWPWPLQWPYTPGPLSPCFTAIMTLTPPMTLHTRPTVTLFYCHHDPDPSNDPTHQAQHPALLSSWPWPLQWSYTSGPLGYCHPVLLSSWPWPLQWPYTPGPLSPCFTVIMTLVLSRLIYTEDLLGIFSPIKLTQVLFWKLIFLQKMPRKLPSQSSVHYASKVPLNRPRNLTSICSLVKAEASLS